MHWRAHQQGGAPGRDRLLRIGGGVDHGGGPRPLIRQAPGRVGVRHRLPGAHRRSHVVPGSREAADCRPAGVGTASVRGRRHISRCCSRFGDDAGIGPQRSARMVVGRCCCGAGRWLRCGQRRTGSVERGASETSIELRSCPALNEPVSLARRTADLHQPSLARCTRSPAPCTRPATSWVPRATAVARSSCLFVALLRT